MKSSLFKKFIIAGVLAGILFSILFSIFAFLLLMITREETGNVSLVSLLGFNFYGYVFLGLTLGVFAYFCQSVLINKKIFKYTLLAFSIFFFSYAIFSLFIFSDLVFLSPIFFMLMTHIIFICPAIDSFSANSFNLFFLSSTAFFLLIIIFEGVVFACLFNYFIKRRL
ncbi:MAG: hypothetical protein U9N04_02525 [Patescibacteria group bacterium]|nr:hypothetical protein [Patescibacteria group bacterium]